MVKKRRGRPPIEGVARSGALTTRITENTRRRLEAAARGGGLSVSRVVERFIEAGLGRPPEAPHNHGLGLAVTHLAEVIERGTGRNWQEDPFAAQALRHGVEALLQKLAPRQQQGAPAVPAAVEREAANMAGNLAAQFRTPAGFGQMAAYNFVSEVKQSPPLEPHLEWQQFLSALESWSKSSLAIIARDLGLAGKKKRKAQ